MGTHQYPVADELPVRDASASPVQPNVLAAGHQDTGIIVNSDPNGLPSGSWQHPLSSPYDNEGDALFFDPNDSSGRTVYVWDGSGGSFQKSIDSGLHFSGLSLNQPTTFLLTFHPTQFNRFMVTANNGTGGCAILETTNGFATSVNLNLPTSGCPSAMAYVGSNYYIFVPTKGPNQIALLYQGVPNGGSVTWTNVWPSGNPQTIPVVSILSDADNWNSVYLATSDGSTPGKVFFKPDISDGTGWAIGAGLKEITGTGALALQFPVASLSIMPSYGRTPSLYATTSAGIFHAASLNGASTIWTRLGSGFPDTPATDVRSDPRHFGVYAATFGRSVWSMTDWSDAPDVVGNGGFEAGNLSGWTSAGAATSVVTSPHSGYYTAQNGLPTPTNGDSTIYQVISVPPGATTVQFSYLMHCPDSVTYDWVTASFMDNTTKVVTTMLPPTCINNSWTTVSAPVGISAGHSITLTLTSHDDDYATDPSYTWFDDVAVF